MSNCLTLSNFALIKLASQSFKLGRLASKTQYTCGRYLALDLCFHVGSVARGGPPQLWGAGPLRSPVKWRVLPIKPVVWGFALHKQRLGEKYCPPDWVLAGTCFRKLGW